MDKTDKEIITEIFKKRGIQFTTDTELHAKEGIENLTVEAGYVGFVSNFKFDAEGKLLSVEAWA